MARDLARGLAEGLKNAGVRQLFGMPGGGPNLDMIGAAEEFDIPFALLHGETAACIAAATYGRITGTPGVALVTRGPGLTSAANGLAQATLDRFPLLLISDAVSEADAARVAHQRLDQVAMARPLTRWSGTLGTAHPSALTEAAARLTLGPPAGAVYLAFDPTVAGDPLPTSVAPTATEPAQVDRARELIAGASRPIIIIGVDAVPRAKEVRAALKNLDCPMLVTYEATGVVPTSWRTYAGIFTGAAIERPLISRADLVVGIGLDSVEPMPGPWDATVPMILFHRHAVEATYFGEPLVVVGEYAEHLPQLLQHARPTWSSGSGHAARRADLERIECPTSGLNPLDVVRATQQQLGKALLTVDAGAHMLVAMPLWETDEPNATQISNGLATMGFSLPAAIGTALANPGRRVVCFTGDGGLGMVLGELETLARLLLDVTVLVFNDAALTLIELKQSASQGGRRAVRYGPVDFAAASTAMGVPGLVVEDVSGLRQALTPNVRGPRLIDARVDAAAYRHVIDAIRG